MFGARSIQVTVTLLLLVFSNSCVPEKLVSLNVVERSLPFPAGYYDHLIYSDNHVIGFAVIDGSPEERIAYAYEGDQELTPFNPEKDQKCVNYSFFQVVSLLPDGRVGLLKECDDDFDATIYLSTNRSIYAYDWRTKELERLVAGKLTPSFDPKNFTWNPSMTLGVQETGPGYPGTIYWDKG